jgi:ABC-type multidrug transport system permease subunit
MNNPFINLFIIQLRRFYREPEVIFWVIFFPIVMSWILGVAFSGKTVKTATIAVVNGSSQIDLTKLTPSFRILNVTEVKAETMLKRGSISLYIKIEDNSIVYYFDKNNSEAYLAYLTIEKLINSVNTGAANIVNLTGKGSRYIDFLIPGLISLGIMNSCIWGLGWGLVELRIRKLIRRMAATPMKKSHFIASHYLSRLIPTSTEAIILYIFAHFYFNFELSGSLTAFILVFLCGNFAFSGIAVLISSRTDSTHMVNGLINAITIPLVILSGIFFSYQNFPPFVGEIIKYLPLAMLTDSIREVFNQGAGVRDVLINSGVLFGIGLIFSTLGLKIFKWH